MTLRRLVASLLVAALLTPGFAFADPARAQQYYNQAALEYEKGNYTAAADLLYQAYAEDANLIYVYNRILALQADGQFKDALRELKVFELRMKDDPEKRFEDVPQIKQQLEERIKLESEKPKETDPKETDPKETDPKETDPKEKDPDPIEDPGTVDEGGGPGILPIALLAGGGLVLGTGVLLSTGVFFSDQTKHDDSVTAIDNFNANEDRAAYETEITRIWETDSVEDAESLYEDAVSTKETQQTLSIVFMATGGALIAGGVIAWIVNSGSGSSDSSSEVPVSAHNFQFAPVVSPNGVGGAFSFDF